MRTAEAIVMEVGELTPAVFQPKYRSKGVINIDEAIEMINVARKEIIEECANKARTRTNDESTSVIVDKQTILSLINELK